MGSIDFLLNDGAYLPHQHVYESPAESILNTYCHENHISEYKVVHIESYCYDLYTYMGMERIKVTAIM
jgi:hypothetical protein